MITKFYVDIDALNDYSTFLRKCIADFDVSLAAVSRANVKYQSVLQDNISKEVDMRIQRLKKILNNFSVEMTNASKKIKEDYLLYQAYAKKLN